MIYLLVLGRFLQYLFRVWTLVTEQVPVCANHGSKRPGKRDISNPGNGTFRAKNIFFPDVKKIVRVEPFLTGRVG